MTHPVTLLLLPQERGGVSQGCLSLGTDSRQLLKNLEGCQLEFFRSWSICTQGQGSEGTKGHLAGPIHSWT